MAISDFENVFGEDYLHFYGPELTPERNAREAAAIWKMLHLQPDRTVLDIGCGHGRIASELARRGARVTGLDANACFLERARAAAAAAGVQVEYVEGDMRALPWRDRFEAALIWYTTFGCFDEAGNETILRQAAAALRPGGRLLIEQINRAALLRQGLPATFRNWARRRPHDRQGELRPANRADLHRAHHSARWQGAAEQLSVRLYGFVDLARLLGAAGLGAVEGFGRNGEPLTLYGRRLIVVSEKTDGNARTHSI